MAPSTAFIGFVPEIALGDSSATSIALAPSDLSAAGAPHAAANDGVPGKPGAKPMAVPARARASADGKAHAAHPRRGRAQSLACGADQSRRRRCFAGRANDPGRAAQAPAHDQTGCAYLRRSHPLGGSAGRIVPIQHGRFQWRAADLLLRALAPGIRRRRAYPGASLVGRGGRRSGSICVGRASRTEQDRSHQDHPRRFAESARAQCVRHVHGQHGYLSRCRAGVSAQMRVRLCEQRCATRCAGEDARVTDATPRPSRCLHDRGTVVSPPADPDRRDVRRTGRQRIRQS